MMVLIGGNTLDDNRDLDKILALLTGYQEYSSFKSATFNCYNPTYHPSGQISGLTVDFVE